ncbi:hypothetical protein FBQ96_05085 [Nitrospirales bacterium NOB]|nr:hypothetical protein [Nitrospirota bacterium]MDL1888945.1 hypothetical protein [Nitrospirales bacterium NOB]QOJ35347.1 MAG: hypothetical protein HRU82_10480 [Nitrospira sp.]
MKFIQIEDMHVDLEKIQFIKEEPQHFDTPRIDVYYASRKFEIRSDSPKWTELQALFPTSFCFVQGAHIDVAQIDFVREEAQSQGQPICVVMYHNRELRVLKGSTEWNALHAKMYGEA